MTDSGRIEDPIISEDLAQQQIDMILDYYNINMDKFFKVEVEGSNANEVLEEEGFRTLQAVIRDGRIEVEIDSDSKLIVKQNLVHRYAHDLSALVYRPLTGRAKIASQKKKDVSFEEKMYNLLATMCSKNYSIILALEGKDLVAAEAVGGLFLLA